MTGATSFSEPIISVVWPRWLVMWMIAVAVYALLKWLSWQTSPTTHVPAWKHAAYLLAWPGMDAGAFLRLSPAVVVRPSLAEWGFAATKLSLGLLTLFFNSEFLSDCDPYLLGWIGMVGLVLTLHFGLFHLLSCVWRCAGINAAPLMDWPVASTSLSEFWGRRWNRAFRDLTHRFVFRPLLPRLGATGALWAGFALSGLVHDLVISLPAGGGWGLPTLYFLLQSAGITCERSRRGQRLGLGRGIRGWLFTATVLLLPVPLLFHRPFAVNVIVSFLQALGAAT
ncbi:MBOAT family protein [Planctellipticum variicoloris]|uniref:MBOAT family protein n=1 Tax=Planctellipticum variicoloris TaxID=3064265 RepID=UPI0030140534|nr:membrane bound O-acyl transferase family-domain-containing protein [Planctomycetaceae bacterium SH412]